MVWWLVGVGVAFGCDTALGDVFLPMAETPLGGHLLGDRGDRAAGALVRRGRPGGRRRPVRPVPVRAARTRLRTRRHLDGGAGRFPAPAARGGQRGQHRAGRRPPDSVPPVVYRALWVPALAPLGGPAEAAYRTFPAWPVIGVVLLALRYRRTDGAQRRKIRWLFLGLAVSASLWIPAALLWQVADPDNAAAAAAAARCPTWGWPPPSGRCWWHCSIPGCSVSTSRRGARSCTVSCGYRSPSCSPSWPSWPACWPAWPRRPPSPWRSRWPPRLRARPSGAVWSTPRTGGCSARGWRATPASAASARA